MNPIFPAWAFRRPILLGLLLVLIGSFALWWYRERMLLRQRRAMRGLMSLSEDILASATPVEIARKIQEALPSLLNASLAEMFVLRPGSNSLERIDTESQPRPLSVNIDSPIGPLPALVALCFRNRALIEVPDASRSPLLDTASRQDLPRAALFVPMFAGTEVLGVVAVQYRTRFQHTTADSQAGLQHLANQIAAAFKLQERKAMQDQLLRSEKLAAAGQLISDVVTDLKAPLAAIAEIASRPDSAELRDIAGHAQRGVELLSHLASFAGKEQSDATLFDLIALASDLVVLRQSECALKGIAMENRLPLSQACVLAERTQVEQIVLTLLVYAERAASGLAEKTVLVDAHIIGTKIQIVIEVPGGSFGEEADLKVSQSLAEAWGGSVRIGSDAAKIELELPEETGGTAEVRQVQSEAYPARMLTIALLESNADQERQLLKLLAARGHRVVPIKDGEQAADLVQRFRFDLLFCCLRPAGVNWVELFSRVRRKVDGFVLMTDVETDAAELFPNADGFVLSKPIHDAELNRVLSIGVPISAKS